MKTYSRNEVAQHNKDGDCWIIIDNRVFDVTKFARFHPGGKWILLTVAGKDATEEFYANHRAEILQKYMDKLCIGTVEGVDMAELSKTVPVPGAISQVPYAESNFWEGFTSRYYDESHLALRSAVRKFFDKELPLSEAAAQDEAGKEPSLEIYQKMGQAGILSGRVGPGDHLKFPGVATPNGIPPEKFTYFHEMIVHEELSRLGCPGLIDGLGAGMIIGLPPVIRFAKDRALAQRVGTEVLQGKKRICLAITDPGAGSDVANINCTAVKTPCGQFYIVNGVKKWITNGNFCDYFTTAVRTGGPGMGGISMLLVERSEGLTTTKIKTSYSPAAGTAYVFYDNVKVPVGNLLGEENQGFRCIMDNFNHERWMIVVGVNRGSRLLVEECFKWASQRKVFGKPLLEQPVIRAKLANMIAQVEAVHHWIENVTLQMCEMSHKDQALKLAGPIALLKLQSTRVSQFVMDEACQIFGGRAITRTGMGQVVERFQRANKFGAILGGSEEIMADLGVRQAMKRFPKVASTRL
eukprot:CAMPEP_0118924594 /NCGR_PEP_ID=MMETSP1169-20130426/2660_1 /TAXON_ID=36882 /ORGANISM="Pyramimonas obovata, Strain CCMP722" /LENGTH=522 /DNA_ID=CAMNT_0006865721 /DNA_START=158 /DNA_END=1726 /DNA_ORIENTATION=-